jgi:hypothetical protein
MVIEAQSPIAELLAKDPVLLAEVVNDLQFGVDSSIRKRRSAESEMGRKLFGVSKPIIDCRPMVKPSRIHADPVSGPYAMKTGHRIETELFTISSVILRHGARDEGGSPHRNGTI